MNARFIHNGNAIDYVPETKIPAGEIVVIGSLIGITRLDLEPNCLGALHLVGVYDIAKDDSAVTLGTPVYWDSTAKKATVTASGNTPLGLAVLDAAAVDAVVRVRLGA